MEDKQIVNNIKRVIFDSSTSLSPNARILYVSLLNVEQGKLTTYDELKIMTGVKSVPTIMKMIKELLDNGLIEVKKTKHGQIYNVL